LKNKLGKIYWTSI